MQMLNDMKKFLEASLLIITKSLEEQLADWLKITPPIETFKKITKFLSFRPPHLSQ